MEINKINVDTQKSMKKRIITGLIMAIVGIPCIVLGDWFFLALVVFISIFAIWEAIKVTGKKYSWYIYLIMYIFTLSFVFWVFLRRTDPVNAGELSKYIDHHFLLYDIRISTMGVGFLLAILFTISIFNENFETKDAFYLFSMSLFIGISLQSVLFLRYCPAAIAPEVFNNNNYFATCLLFLFVLGGTCLNDIFAYFVGVLFGKHKMNPRVSPKKTWEGFAGGIVLSSIITSIFAIVCDVAFNTPLIAGYLDAEHWYYVILTSILVSFSSVLGDLMFSLIKRSYNIKDFGNVFPGHGGVLDRFDSLLITSLLVAILISFIVYTPFMGVIN